LIRCAWFNSYVIFLLLKCYFPPFLYTFYTISIAIKDNWYNLCLRACLHLFHASKNIHFFPYGLSGSNPCHYNFPDLNKLLSTLVSSFSFVFHTHYAYAFQILLVRKLKLFIVLWMFFIATYTFHKLYYIPWKGIFIGYKNPPWFSLSRFTCH
jgi:hypothetical protein